MNAKLYIVGILALVVIFLVGGGMFFYISSFGAPDRNAKEELFIVPLKSDQAEAMKKLEDQGFIKSPWAFRFALSLKEDATIKFGGYTISKSMNAWEIADVFSRSPTLKWITIPEGLRKEEIAEILGKELGWSVETQKKWVDTDTTTKSDYIEGVYFPDTYLIPLDESSVDVAERLQARFQEKFAPLSAEALKQNIKWTTLLKIASIVQREAAGKSDMPLIAGVLWNRLLKDMRLEIDATLQYARGDEGEGWWAPIGASDKQIDSPYNTYKNEGLPPHPIANPGVDAIKAVLFPEETKCFYYLHDNSGQIHCAVTFEEHKKNIEQYL